MLQLILVGSPSAVCGLHRCRASRPAWPVQRVQHVIRSLLNTDSVDFGASVELPTQAAALGLKPEQFKRVLSVLPAAAHMEPSSLFCVKQIADMLQMGVVDVLAIMDRHPQLCNVTPTKVESLLEALGSYFGLLRQQAARLVAADPALMLMPPHKVDAQVRRICSKCKLPLSKACQLASLTPAVLISDTAGTCTKVLALAAMLSTPPTTVVDVLASEQQHFGNAERVLGDVASLASGWRAYSKQLGAADAELMQAMAEHVLLPQPRYSLCQLPKLSADVASMAAQLQLDQRFACGVVLAAPGIVDVPRGFWVLLMEHILVRRPHWRQQLSHLTAAEFVALVLSLLVSEQLQLGSCDLQVAPVDIESHGDLQQIEALAGGDITPPLVTTKQKSASMLQAGKIWRLLYLCSAHQHSTAQHQDLLGVTGQHLQQFSASHPGYLEVLLSVTPV